MDINNIKWQPATKKPEDWDEPILCCTSKGKLCVFKETKGKYPSKDKEPKYISLFNRIKNDYNVVYWVYQKDVLPDEFKNK